jgi:poly(A) polymerase
MDRASFEHIVDEVRPVADALTAHGFRVYLVGGIVRDLLVERPRHAPDIDLTTDATPDEIERALAGHTDALWKQGARFGTIGCRVGARVFEITTHRSEAYLSESRKPIVRFSRRIDDDLSRRDFTVNAMALSLPEGELIDPFGGADDLAAKILRTPLSPEISFSDDPLRMLRAARFVAGYGLVPEMATEAAIGTLRARLEIVSRERIHDELDKLLRVTDPTSGLALLRRTELLAEVVPELAAIDETWFELVRRVEGMVPRRAAFFLPIVDRSVAKARARALKYSTDDLEHLGTVLRTFDGLHALDRVDAPAVRRLARAAGDALDDALAVATAVPLPIVASVRATLDELSRTEDLRALAPELDGDDVQRLLGISEGRDVGRALAFLLELRLDEGLLGADEAARRLLDWWSSQSPT